MITITLTLSEEEVDDIVGFLQYVNDNYQAAVANRQTDSPRAATILAERANALMWKISEQASPQRQKHKRRPRKPARGNK